MVSSSKILVVGPEEVKEHVLPHLQKKFSTVVFAPPEKITLFSGEDNKALFGKVDLSTFSYALILADSSKKEFYYTLTRVLNQQGVKTSISVDSLFYFWQRPVLFRILSREGIPIRKIYAISQDVAAEVILKELKLPVIIVPPSEKAIYVSKEETLKNVLSLFSPGNMITAQKPIKVDSSIIAFATPTEVVAYEKIEENRRATVPDDRAKEIAQNVRKAVNSDFITVFMLKKGKKYYVSNVRLLPPFKTFKKVAGRDLGSIIAAELVQLVPEFSFLDAIESATRTFVEGFVNALRWLGDEISNNRSPKKRL